MTEQNEVKIGETVQTEAAPASPAPAEAEAQNPVATDKPTLDDDSGEDVLKGLFDELALSGEEPKPAETDTKDGGTKFFDGNEAPLAEEELAEVETLIESLDAEVEKVTSAKAQAESERDAAKAASEEKDALLAEAAKKWEEILNAPGLGKLVRDKLDGKEVDLSKLVSARNAENSGNLPAPASAPMAAPVPAQSKAKHLETLKGW